MGRDRNENDDNTSTTRRDFLKVGIAGVAGAGLTPYIGDGLAAAAETTQASSGPVPNLASVKADGDWYDAQVPDTLDLAKRGELSLNVMTRNVEPANKYSVYQMFQLAKPVLPARNANSLLWNGTAKNARTLPWLRTMCGSTAGRETEFEMMRVLNAAIDQYGHVRYLPTVTAANDAEGEAIRDVAMKPGVPLANSTANPIVNALTALGMDNWYQRDQNPAWKARIHLISQGLQEAALKADDRAYYPLECGYDVDKTWRVLRQGHLLPYTPPDEPIYDQQGAEGAVKIQNMRQVAALVRDYQLSGDPKALDMARRIARFVLKPTMWVDASAEGLAGHEHAMWEGHFHGNAYTLHMLLNLAAVDDDPQLKRFIREGYHHGHRFGVAAMGWFPAWTYPPPNSAWGKGRLPTLHNNRTEGCAVSDMAMLGIKLSDAGLGDYWDDVDHIVRNHLVEQQLTNIDLMRQIAGGGNSHDAVLERFVGGFGSARPTGNLPRATGCCSANCAVGLYYAWHGITRFQDGLATVNLFLNRASTWMDVDSYLPYEGKVVLRNKQADTALVRVPAWLRGAKIASTIGGRPVAPVLSGNYLMFPKLRPKDEITLTFPVPTSQRLYTIAGVKYQLTFRGSTVVDITPRSEEAGLYPTYLREHMKATTAPMTRVKRFAPHRVLPLL